MRSRGQASRRPSWFLIAGAAAGANRKAEPLDDWRTHDLRRSGVSALAQLGFDSIVVDKLLAHQPGKLRGAALVGDEHAGRSSGTFGRWT